MLRINSFDKDVTDHKFIDSFKRDIWPMVNELGFVNTLFRDELWSDCEKRSSELSHVKNLVVIGIGGSVLGTKTIWHALGKYLNRLDSLTFFDNLDPEVVETQIKKVVELNSLHIILVSKSGNTLESLVIAELLDHALKSQSRSLIEICTVITEKKPSPLFDWALKNKISILEVPKDVSGRFSVLTPVGMLPAALMGLNLNEFKNGMSWVLENPQMVGNLVEACIRSYQRKDDALYFWPYRDKLNLMGYWFQQLWAESLGKKLTLDGSSSPVVSIPVTCLGPRDQHSILQQVIEGPQSKWVWMIRVKEGPGPVLENNEPLFQSIDWMRGKALETLVNAQQLATTQSLSDANVSVLEFEFDELSSGSLSALFFLFEICVAEFGRYLKINPFDQPGVESGKKMTQQLLSSQN